MSPWADVGEPVGLLRTGWWSGEPGLGVPALLAVNGVGPAMAFDRRRVNWEMVMVAVVRLP